MGEPIDPEVTGTTAMRNHRFKRQTNAFGVFVGITAYTIRTPTAPTTGGDPISNRVWLDTTTVTDLFRNTPIILSEDEIEWVRTGLRQVVEDIESTEPQGHIIIVVHGLERVEVDYIEPGLAAAIAGWAADEFGFLPHRASIRREEGTNQYVLEWAI